jgi:uncharacterized protein (TIGR02145 family)
MLFIRTNTAGYGEENGVKYLEIETKNTHYPSGKMKIALTNLGATNDNNLGDFYQWGRVGDGYQVIGWAKQTGTSRNNTFDAATDENRYPGGTTQIPSDGSINREPVGLTLTSSGQVESGNGYGKFIPAGSATYYDWSNKAARNKRWGNGNTSFSGRTSDIAFSSWTFNGVVSVTNPDGANNNPCPGGWSVPSRWQWKDMHDGNGSSTTDNNAWSPADDAINDWGTFRAAQHGSFGGAVITNPAGEKVFLPAAGNRFGEEGSLKGAGSYGLYWSSTSSPSTSAYYLYFTSGYVATSTNSSYSNGHSVRCVAEF